MVDLVTPAGNPAGRFPADKHAALDAVFAEAAPLTPGEVEIPDTPGKMSRADALVWALGELDSYSQINRHNYKDKEKTKSENRKTASELAAMWGIAAGALDKIIQAFEAKENTARFDLPEQIRDSLMHFARQEASRSGGFLNYPLEIDRIILDGKELSVTEFHEVRQLDQNIEGLFQLRRWARQAECSGGACEACTEQRRYPRDEASRERTGALGHGDGIGIQYLR